MVESLTDSIESDAMALIETIDELGGMVKAIEQVYPQREIEKASYTYQKSIEKGDQKVVGVNAHQDDGGTAIDVFNVNPAIEQSQLKSLGERKAKRDASAVEAALTALDNAATGSENLFPFILDAVKQSVTVGEICAALAVRFGRYRERTTVR